MGAIGVHHTVTSEWGWDGPANEARLKGEQTAAYYRQAFAWQDPDGDPKTKAAYRFIHHEVDGQGAIGAANLRACSAGIGVLNGGRGGTTIPAEDVAGVYRHLAAHLKDADREPPELQRSQAPTPSPSPDFKGGEMERRAVAQARLEVRADAAGKPVIAWYPAVYEQWSNDLGGFRELVERGAFAEALRPEADIRAFANHEAMYLLGRTAAGTLRLSDDDYGLRAEVEPPETQWASDLLVSMRRGDLAHGSFGFITPPNGDTWQRTAEGVTRRLRKIDLVEVSVVAIPAYPQTSAQVALRARQVASGHGQETGPSGGGRGQETGPNTREQLCRRLELVGRG